MASQQGADHTHGCAWARTGGMADRKASSVTVAPALQTG